MSEPRLRVPAVIAGEYVRLGTAVRERRMTIEQALKEIAMICIHRHEHYGLMLVSKVDWDAYMAKMCPPPEDGS